MKTVRWMFLGAVAAVLAGCGAEEIASPGSGGNITINPPAGDTTDPDTCSSTNNTWSALTDSDFITVSALVFDLDGSSCLNTREPDSVNNDGDADTDEADEADCYDTPFPTASSGDITVETLGQ